MVNSTHSFPTLNSPPNILQLFNGSGNLPETLHTSPPPLTDSLSSMPDLIYPSSSEISTQSTGSNSLHHPYTNNNSSHLTVSTMELAHQLNKIRRSEPSPAVTEGIRPPTWALTHRTVQDLNEKQRRTEIKQDNDVLYAGRRAIGLLYNTVRPLLDLEAIDKRELFDLEASMEEAAAKYEGERSTRFEYLMREDVPKLAAVSVQYPDGTSRIRRNPSIPPSRDERYSRVFSAHALAMGAPYQTALIAESKSQPENISRLTDIRYYVKDFIKFGLENAVSRRMDIDLSVLHHPGPLTLPYLFGQENSQLSLVEHVYSTKHGNVEIAKVANQLRHFRFRKPQRPRRITARLHGWRVYLRITTMIRAGPTYARILRVEQRPDYPENHVGCIVHHEDETWVGVLSISPRLMQALPLLPGALLTMRTQYRSDHGTLFIVTIRHSTRTIPARRRLEIAFEMYIQRRFTPVRIYGLLH
ncbi:hypothetical protein R3P38DRAFT_2844986 [Favolaschia claudopus]|uniref:Uncharacterized protein n=1 Tax=Favolaschia claudopus TaxID=2862362 RepID=A0AAW0DSZ7_9AGAR